MGEFVPIETQEAFDEALKDRLERKESAVRKEYEGYLSPEQASEKYAGYLSQDEVAEKYKSYLSPEQAEEKYKGYLSPEEASAKDAKIKAYETDSVKTRIALENGLPYEFGSRLAGEDEESIREDALRMAKLIKSNRSVPPLASNEGAGDKSRDAARKMLAGLKGE